MATTKLDQFGRVVIPKPIRDDLGLKPGTVLEIREDGDAIVLRSADPSPTLRVKGHVLVFTGEAQGDLLDAVRNQREERMRIVGGMEEP